MYKNEVKLNSKDLETIVGGYGANASTSASVKKVPSNILRFKQSAVGEVDLFAVGLESTYYVVDRATKTLSQYQNVDGEPILIKTGVNLSSYTRLIRLVEVEDGLLLFTNDETEGEACIWKTPNIDTLPTLVYKSSTGDNAGFFSIRNQFGIDVHSNGLTSIVLAGVYGRGNTEQDLLLSTDSGSTFNVVKKTTTTTTDTDNSHWHDVAIDTYHGLLWASQGDGVDKRNVYWSSDMGETWNILNADDKDHIQPTAVLPFSDRIIFGRDSGVAGLDVAHKPTDARELTSMKMDDLAVIKNVPAHWYYGISALTDGQEGYMYFLIVDQEPRMVMGTGDGGKSWHSVFMGYGSEHDGGTISGLAGIDDNYMYAYRQKTGGALELLYSERIKWV
ncbi:hypothetical protein [Aerococcus urinaeequi]|uniref:hypothetical protein n=1 Tax=Aerococcus urinaeequi TaxID=51665 RepID=UPI003D6B55C4